MKQLNLFDNKTQPIISENTDADKKRADSDLCLLFTSSFTVGHGKYHFLMNRKDAMKWCSDKRTKGKMMGGEWAYHFNGVKYVYDGGIDNLIVGKNVTDNGKYIKLLDELQCHAIPFNEWRSLLEPLGFTVKEAA